MNSLTEQQKDAYIEWLKEGYRQIADGTLPDEAKEDMYKRFARDTLSGPTWDALNSASAVLAQREQEQPMDETSLREINPRGEPYYAENAYGVPLTPSQPSANVSGETREQRLRDGVEFIRKIASGEEQVAPDDTGGMEFIDRYCRDLLTKPQQETREQKVLVVLQSFGVDVRTNSYPERNQKLAAEIIAALEGDSK